MTQTRYQRVAELVSRVRNAKFADIVAHLEQLIDSELWQDFTTPVGTHFEFRAKEFDYFLAAQEVDPTIVRTAYLKAEDVDGLATKQMHLADITGRGEDVNGDRRARNEVAAIYDTDPSGAGARIRAWGEASAAVVTEGMARVARDQKRRSALESGRRVLLETRKRWEVRWTDDRSPAEVIASRLFADPALAHEVYKILDAAESRRRYDQTRRSEALKVAEVAPRNRKEVHV